MSEPREELLYQWALTLEAPTVEYWDIEDPALKTETEIDELCFGVAQTILGQVATLERESEPMESDIREMFDTGSPRGSIYIPWTIRQFQNVIPTSLRRDGAVIGNTMRKVMRLKGFLYPPATYTVAEHDAIGSSVSSEARKYATDMPVNYVFQLLAANGVAIREGRELYTLDEIDRSRRLGGLTTVDLETGRVTDKIDEDAAKDPYYFLTDDQKPKVIDLENSLTVAAVDLYGEALKLAKEALGILKVIRAHALGQVTTDEMQEMFDRYITMPGIALKLEEQLRAARILAVNKGMLDPLLTPQEILMRVGGEVADEYLANPYIPLAVQDGRLTTVEANKRRSSESNITHTVIIANYEAPFCIELVELDNQGRTVKSPTFLDRSTLERTESDEFKDFFKGLIKVPFAREDDWFYRKEK